VRLILILLIVASVAATSRGQTLESCAQFTSPYRSLENRAINKAPASFPNERHIKGKSKVLVLIKVDRTGRVVSARAVCGHPLLINASVASARKWTFRPRRVKGKRVNYVGTIAFEFGPDASSDSGP
jgi:outer membrane biosynthesis protein TonB